MRHERTFYWQFYYEYVCILMLINLERCNIYVDSENCIRLFLRANTAAFRTLTIYSNNMRHTYEQI